MTVDTQTMETVLPAGTPCWAELSTTDSSMAQRFYGGLFGWDFHVRNDPSTLDRRYAIASLDGTATAGIRQVSSDTQPGWSTHLAVNNTENTAEWVEYLGGVTTIGPVDIPERGSILHVNDPGGVPVVFWRPSTAWEFATGVPNTFAGADLYTHDSVVSDRFFCRLFNLTREQIGLGSIDYTEWRLAGTPVVYRYVMGSEYHDTTPPHWLAYFTISPERGTEAVAGHAIWLGGTVIIGPYATPFGSIAVLADPAGAVFAVIDHSRPIEGWRQTEVDDLHDD